MKIKQLMGCLFIGYLGSYIYASDYDVAIIGDDISTQSANTDYNWVDYLEEDTDCIIRIYNSSKRNTTSKDGYLSFEMFLKKHAAKVAIIELGHNDAKKENALSALEKNLDAIIALSEQHHIKAILLGIDLTPEYSTLYRQLFKNTFERVAKNHHIEFIMSEYATDPTLVKKNSELPNENGHKRIAEHISPMINELICKQYD